MRKYNFFLYLTVFITGASVLILEILGTRVIAPFYGSTLFVWSSLITVTLGFLALGYFWGGKIVDKRPQAVFLYLIIFLSSVFVVLILKVDQKVLIFTDQFGLKYGPLVSSLILFAPSFLLLGMVTPFAIRLVFPGAKKIGSSSGRIFAISTLGSVAGALLAGFYLLPVFSLIQIFNGLGLILVLLSLIGFLIYKGVAKGKLFALLAPFLIISLFVPKISFTPKGAFELMEQRQSFFGDIKVINLLGVQYSRCLYVNGSGQTCIDSQGNTDGFFQRFLRNELPRLGLDQESRVLLLGLGGGGILSLIPEDVRVDIVEIDLEVARLARKYFVFEEIGNRKLIIDDARHFLASTETGQYDLVLENIALGNSVPSHVLTREAWVDMRRVLKNDGILLAHIGSHEINGDNVFNQSVYSTAASVFNYYLPLSSLENEVSNLVLYLSSSPINYEFAGEPKLARLTPNKDLVVTDDSNKLDYYYLSNAISQRENTKGLGNEIFFVK